jgi:hypothetical protein
VKLSCFSEQNATSVRAESGVVATRDGKAFAFPSWLWREQMEQAAGTTGQDCDWGGHVRARNGKWELVPQQPDLHIGSHTLVFLLVLDQNIKTSTI